jgi:hypothetical protein
MRDRRPLTTALSHPEAPFGRGKQRNALARSSQALLSVLLLATAGALSSTGCLIAEAPDYGEPRRTTPMIDHESIEPDPWFVVEVTPELPVPPFQMTVRSEDAGEGLLAVPVLNYGIPDRQEVLFAFEAPARAADQPKTVRVEIPLAELLPLGCHTVTVLVMHTSSFDYTTGLPRDVVSDGDVASVTWWVQATTPPDGPEKPCPKSTGATQ